MLFKSIGSRGYTDYVYIPQHNQEFPPFSGTLDHLCNRSTADAISTGINSCIASNHYTTIFPSLFKVLSQSCSNGLSKALLPRDIIFFSQILALYQLELRKGNDSVVYSSEKLARLLGFNSSLSCNMRSVILKTTKKLEELGLLKVKRSVTYSGRNKTNELVPLLPDSFYNQIKDSSYNFSISDSDRLGDESNLDHILRTKLFVPLDLSFLKNLFADNISPKYKVFLFNCIISAYRNYKLNGRLSFCSTSKELMQINNISRSTLDRIFSYIKSNAPDFFIKIEHKYTKSDDIDSNRWDKSIFSISVDPLVFHAVINKDLSSTLDIEIEDTDGIKLDEVIAENVDISTNNSDTYKDIQVASSKKPPSIVKKEALIIKNKEIKKKYSKDIDYIDANSGSLNNLTCKHSLNSKNLSEFNLSSKFLDKFSVTESLKEEELENDLCSFSSESYKNYSFSKDLEEDYINKAQGSGGNASPLPNSSTEHASRAIIDISEKESRLVKSTGQKPNIGDTTTTESAESKKELSKKEGGATPYKELRHFYPLSDRDISNLNFYAEREFSSNFVNQLLLKLYIKYPEKRFKNKFTFLSYMKKLLANEKHQGPLVNHASFRFSCNINEEDKNMLYYERYLTEIENSLDTSKEMQIRKKIAGRFDTKLAYAILKQVSFKTNFDNSFVTALIPINSNLVKPSYTNQNQNKPSPINLNPTNKNSMNRNLDLSEAQIETLSQQLEAVYGKNGYYVKVVGEEEEVRKKEGEEAIGKEKEETAEEEKTKETLGISKNIAKVKDSKTEEKANISKTSTFAKISEGVPLSSIPTNTVWYLIRQGLIEELGLNIDKAWFSKVVAQEAKECNKNATLTLTMPTRFMVDWVRNNYSHVIQRLAGHCGVKRVEYNCDSIN